MKFEYRDYELSNAIIDIAAGPFGSNLKVSCFTETGFPIIDGANLKGITVTDNITKFVSEDRARSLHRSIAKRRDIVVTISGNVGQISYIPDNSQYAEYLCSQRQFRVTFDESKIYVPYLVYYLHSVEGRSKILAFANQTGVPALSQPLKNFRKIKIDLPSLENQHKIADILSTLDEKIAINRAINDNLLEQMQALYKSWFVDYLPFGGVIPESWTQTNIYSLANIIYGAPFASKQFNTEGNGKPIIRIRDLKAQQFATYTTEVHPKGYLLRPGDIVVGMDGEFRPYIWGNDEAWLNQRVCVFENKRPNGKAFLYFTIKPLLYAIEQTQVATTVIHIGKKDYDAFEIMLPDAVTLDSFDSLTSPMIMQIVSNSFENKRLAAMRDALLPKLMSGELDVSTVEL